MSRTGCSSNDFLEIHQQFQSLILVCVLDFSSGFVTNFIPVNHSRVEFYFLSWFPNGKCWWNNPCLKSTTLWHYVKKPSLMPNMRVSLLNDPSAKDFSMQLLTNDNDHVPEDWWNGLISNFCNFVSTKCSSTSLLIRKITIGWIRFAVKIWIT